jgi:hypothetical protein
LFCDLFCSLCTGQFVNDGGILNVNAPFTLGTQGSGTSTFLNTNGGTVNVIRAGNSIHSEQFDTHQITRLPFHPHHNVICCTIHKFIYYNPPSTDSIDVICV